jgi:hypothetical protein
VRLIASICDLGASRPAARWPFAGVLALVIGLSGGVARASAQASERDDTHVYTAAESARAGMFLPFAVSPQVRTQRAFVRALGGYDSANHSPRLESAAEVVLYGPIALRVGMSYGERGVAQARPSGGLRVQLLRQDKHAIDLALGVFYKPEGFTEAEGEVETMLSFGRRRGRWNGIATLVYGQDPEASERDGEVRLAGLFDVLRALQVGVDIRGRMDLGGANSESRVKGAPTWDVVAGPVASYAFGPVAVLAQVGLSGRELGRFEVGVIGLGGIACAM